MGRFVLRQTNTGIKFDLKTSDGDVLATSEVYTTQRACLNGIRSVCQNAPIAALEDQTLPGYAVEKHPKFQVYADRSGIFRFRLKARNGEVIATSEGFRSKTRCLSCVSRVRENVQNAETVRG